MFEMPVLGMSNQVGTWIDNKNRELHVQTNFYPRVSAKNLRWTFDTLAASVRTERTQSH